MLDLARKAKAAVLSVVDKRHREFRAQREIIGPDARSRAAEIAVALLPPCGTSAHPESNRLSNEGYLLIPDIVGDEQTRDLRAYFSDKLARDIERPELGRFSAPDEVPPQTHVAYYDCADVIDAPHLLSIANSVEALALAESYLGAIPVIGSMRVWWSTPTPSGEPEAAELFHRDVDDIRFLKLFVYLTDVNDQCGPHVFIRGSHRSEALTAIRRYSDAEVGAAFLADDAIIFTGPAGTAFIESTYGLHRGLPPVRTPRLIFQVLYTIRPVIYGPRRPVRRFRPSEAALDRRVNGVYLKA